jgi:hypothetical protein
VRAVTGRADYIVSADADLLSLRQVQSIPIVNAPTFWQTVSESVPSLNSARDAESRLTWFAAATIEHRADGCLTSGGW